MKTKDYILKYKLNLNDKFNHNEFIQDLTKDFLVILELNKSKDNIKGFKQSVNVIRLKWDSINNKTVGCLPDKLWNYFYATVIVKLKEEFCPDEIQKIKFKKEEFEKRKKGKKKMMIIMIQFLIYYFPTIN